MLKSLGKENAVCDSYAFVCDICGKQIASHGQGVVVTQFGAKDGELLDIMHAHKGACHGEAEHRLGGKAKAGWQELIDHLLLLGKETGVEPNQLEERVKELVLD